MRNMQLAMWSILLGLVPVFSTLTPSGKMDQDTTVVVLMCPGHDWTCCSTVMKYGDTILKGFATSVAVVLATVLSIFIWNAQVDGGLSGEQPWS
jgi:UDP-sugar transporter A1/2/3